MTLLRQSTHAVIAATAAHLMHHFLLEEHNGWINKQTSGWSACTQKEKKTNKLKFSGLLLMREMGLSLFFFLAKQHRNKKWREDKARWTIPAVLTAARAENKRVFFPFVYVFERAKPKSLPNANEKACTLIVAGCWTTDGWFRFAHFCFRSDHPPKLQLVIH